MGPMQYGQYMNSPYAMYGYGPQSQMQQPQQQPVHGFVYVTGIDGAKAYQMPPNSEMPLFDDSGDVLYIKTTDGAAIPGALATAQGTASEPLNLSVPFVIRNVGCLVSSTITYAISAAGVINNLPVVAEKK